MVKFYESNFSYDYHWPAVTLAFFLRYPNPYSTHVVSSDTLSSHLDPSTGLLHVTRLHLKRGKLPSSIARFLPKIKESFILERSVVDVRNQRLTTESRNLDYESVLSVVESQTFTPAAAAVVVGADGNALETEARTDCQTVVRFESRFGARARRKETEQQKGWFTGGWVAGGVQRNIELVGRSRMREGLRASREGMKVVLEQLRERGLASMVNEQRQGGWAGWKKVWQGGEKEGLADEV